MQDNCLISLYCASQTGLVAYAAILVRVSELLACWYDGNPGRGGARAAIRVPTPVTIQYRYVSTNGCLVMTHGDLL